MAHLFILDVYVSPNRKYVNPSIIYYILDFSFFLSQDDAYFHIHQNDPTDILKTSLSMKDHKSFSRDDDFQIRSCGARAVQCVIVHWAIFFLSVVQIQREGLNRETKSTTTTTATVSNIVIA